MTWFISHNDPFNRKSVEKGMGTLKSTWGKRIVTRSLKIFIKNPIWWVYAFLITRHLGGMKGNFLRPVKWISWKLKCPTKDVVVFYVIR